MISRLQLQTPLILSIVRIAVGIFFSMHGMVIFHWIHPQAMAPPGGGHAPAHGMPGPDLHLLAGFLELVGGFLFVLGLFTSPVAFILSGEMAVAYFMAHFPQGFWPISNGGDAAVLYCFIFFLYVFTGPGEFSLDELIARRRTLL